MFLKVSIQRFFTKTSKYVDGSMQIAKIGYINRNTKKSYGHKYRHGNDHELLSYRLKYLKSNYRYGENGINVFNARVLIAKVANHVSRIKLNLNNIRCIKCLLLQGFMVS